MGLEAGNPVVGGTVLRREAIQSPDFAHNVSGWKIGQDGTAEFNNVVIRNGQVISGTDLFYNGPPAAGSLVASVSAINGTDQFGNAFLSGVVVYDPLAFIALQIGGVGTQRAITWSNAPSQAGPYVAAFSINLRDLNEIDWILPSPSGQLVIGFGAATTSALLEVQGALNVIGASTNQLVYIEQDGTAGHGLTVSLVGSGGPSQAAINAVSQNSAFTAVEITGVEKTHGTLKIAHKGYADGSDSGAAAISIDLQTVGGVGTKAGGIFITSTTDDPYAADVNLLNLRFDNTETVIKTTADGPKAGIAVPVSHVPSAMLEIDLAGSETHHLDLRDGAGTHCYLYTSAGALVYRGGTGTVTTIAPA